MRLSKRRPKHTRKLEVLLDGQRVGILMARDSDHAIAFQYDAHWIANGHALSPMPQFALKNEPFFSKNHTFEGLHGVFNDALPDGWGLLLMDRAFKESFGWDRHEITPLDRLAYINNRAMGALEFIPPSHAKLADPAISISTLAESALDIHNGLASESLAALYIHGGSPGGARPKAVVALSDDASLCASSFSPIPKGYHHWLVKFRTPQADPPCMARIEMAYADMARKAGIRMPETRLLHAEVHGLHEEFFATRRFDRTPDTKIQTLSIGGMLDLSHRVPAIDYENLIKTVGFATQNSLEVDKAFRLMAFNILAHNRDDHVKNFAFIRDRNQWSLSPGYDLTFSFGINKQHSTTIGGAGTPSFHHVSLIGQNHCRTWEQILTEVYTAVSSWPDIAAEHGVAQEFIDTYWSAITHGPLFNHCRKTFFATTLPTTPHLPHGAE